MFIAVQNSGARVLMTGHWGDQCVFSQEYLIDLLRRLRWITVFRHLHEYPGWMTDATPGAFRVRFLLSLIGRHVPEGMLPVLRRIRAAIGSYDRDCPWYTDRLRVRAHRGKYRAPRPPGGFASAHASSLYASARSRIYVAGMEWNNKVAAMHGHQMTYPFLDRDLLAFVMGIPGEVLTLEGVPKGLFRRAMRGVLPQPIAERRWKADFADLMTEGIDRDGPILTERLQRSLAAVPGYLNEPVWRAELAALPAKPRADRVETAYRMMGALGLQLWLEAFFAGPAESAEVTAPQPVEAALRG
jgi:hypothetical protein